MPPPAPAPLSAAPADEPVSSVWPETMGERPSLRSALAGTEVPAPTPPREDAPAPEGEAEASEADAIEAEAIEVQDEAAPPALHDEPALDALQPPDHFADALADAEDDDEPLPEPSGFSIADLAHETDFDDPPVRAAESDLEVAPADDAEQELARESGLESVFGAERGDDSGRRGSRSPKRRGGRDGRTSTAVLDELEVADDEPLLDEPQEHRRSVNVLAILALAIGVLACPLAALFGHLALNQLKVSGERGVIPAWAAVVLGYLWLGFWIVFGVAYFAANG